MREKWAYVTISTPLAEEDEDATSSSGPVDFGMGFEPQANFLARWYAHALSVGLGDPSCRQIVLGAHWIWEQSAARYPIHDLSPSPFHGHRRFRFGRATGQDEVGVGS